MWTRVHVRGRQTLPTTDQKNAKAISAGESHIRAKVMPKISEINRDISDVEREIADTEKKLNQLKANKRNLEGNLDLVPVVWAELQKSIDALKIPREEWEGSSDEEYEEEQAHHRMLIAVYTGNKNIA